MFSAFDTKEPEAIIVVGDIHGDLNQLMNPLIKFLSNEDKYKKLIYLGDYIDRGESDLYIYSIIRFIRSLPRYKDRIIFLRGNHETYDASIYDYYDKRETNKTIKSFVWDEISKIDFDIVHYDQDLKIVFSHSPMSKPLQEVLSFNLTKNDKESNLENTFTEYKRNPNIDYRNIFGHIHSMSHSETFVKFFNNETKMLCLDGDASYGIGLVNNFQNIQKKPLVSRVKYLVIHNANKYKLCEENINFDDVNNNYNLYKFNDLKKKLTSCNSYINNQINGLKLQDLINVFEEQFKKVMNTEPKHDNITACIRSNFEKCSKLRTGNLVYFNNVPVDIYNNYNLFKDEKYNEIGKLFWNYVLNKEDVYKKMYLIRELKYEEPQINYMFNINKLIGLCVIILSIIVIIVIISSKLFLSNINKFTKDTENIYDYNEE